MCTISYINTNPELHVVNEDFFPVKVVQDPSVESTKYVGFYCGDTDLLEFSVDRETYEIKKFMLVLCNHFELLDKELRSATVCETGSISLNLPQHNECSVFSVQVYKNAVEVILSNEAVQRNIKSGQVIFGLSADNELVRVTIAEMSELDICHTINELNMGMTND